MAGYSATLRNKIFKQHEAIRLAEDTFSFKSDRNVLQDAIPCQWFITFSQ